MATTFDRAPPHVPSPSLSMRIGALVRNASDLARDHIELAALEAHRAATSLTKILAAVVVIAILAVTAWLTFVASVLVWATDKGVSWPVALAIAGAINLVVAAGLAFWAKSQAGDLGFAATLRQLRRTAEEAKEEVR